MNINKKSLASAVFLVAISFTAGYGWGRGEFLPGGNPVDKISGMVKGENASKPVTKADFSIFWDAWNDVEKNYALGPLDEQKMVYGAISGMVDSLGDPYSTFMTPDENKSLSDDLKGVFGGIGAEIGSRDGSITVVAPLKGSPAEKAGILAGDKIVEIDGNSTQDMSVDEVVKEIRGQVGTKVKLKIERDGKDLLFEITRDTIVDKTVNWEMKDGKIAYISISQFKQDTAKELNDQIGDILAHGPNGIILDLRNNPGGSLDTVINVASRFIDKDQVIVTVDYGSNQEVYKASGDKRFSGLPMVVLVNEGSASASEILAGALKDYKLATLVGKKTFGKGLVQEISELKDGSSLKLTVAKWLTPNGTYINKNGIAPDVEVDYTEKDFKAGKDPQLDKALQLLRK